MKRLSVSWRIGIILVHLSVIAVACVGLFFPHSLLPTRLVALTSKELGQLLSWGPYPLNTLCMGQLSVGLITLCVWMGILSFVVLVDSSRMNPQRWFLVLVAGVLGIHVLNTLRVALTLLVGSHLSRVRGTIDSAQIPWISGVVGLTLFSVGLWCALSLIYRRPREKLAAT